MLNLKNIYSKFITLVVVFLVLIGANALISRYMPLNKDKDQVEGTVIQEDLAEEMTKPVESTEPAEVSEPVFAEDQEVMFEADENSAALVVPVAFESQVDGQNAFELLKAATKIEYKEYDFGVFVESINGVKGNDKFFWAFYVNGEQALAGADKTILQKGDKVEWRYEEIK